MLKKVLYISYDGMTDPLGQSQVLPYLSGLSKKGYEFTLLSFEKKDRYHSSALIIEKLCSENNIRWEPQFFTSRPPLLSKVYDSYKMKKKVQELHNRYHFDFLHCRSYVAASAGLQLLKKENIPFLFDMRGFWVDERVDNGQWNLKNPLFRAAYKLFKKKEKQYFNNAAHIISLTEKGKKELTDNYTVPAAKITVIPCCVDLDHFDYAGIDEAAREKIKKQLGIRKEEKVLSYLGSLGGWYLTDEMLDFFKVLQQSVPGTKFLFITKDKKETILQKAVDKGITPEAILVHPATRNEVPFFLSVSNWSIFFIKDAYSKKASSPTKQGEIMAMGIPVICNDIGDTGYIIESTQSGIVINDLEPAGFTKAIKQLDEISMLPKEKIRESARVFFDLQSGLCKYEQIYRQLS